MPLRIEINDEQLREVKRSLADLKESVQPRVRARAANRSRTTLRAETARIAKAVLPTLKIGTIKARIGGHNATASDPVATLVVKRRPLLLTLFNPRASGSGLSARTPQGQYPGAFLNLSTRSTGRSRFFAFRRVGKSRYPIEVVAGPTLAEVIEPQSAQIEARGIELLEKNLQHEIDYALTRTNAPPPDSGRGDL